MRSLFLIRHNFALLVHEPGPVLSRIGMPLVLIAVLQPLYTAALGDRGPTQVVTGMLILFSMLALSIISGGILTERSWHTIDRLRATPAGAAQIILGKAVPYGAVVVVQQAIVIGYGAFLLGMPIRQPGLLMLTVLTWAATLLCAGAALATVIRSHAELAAVTDLGALFLTALSGAVVPLALMPGWLQTLAPASPGYWALAGLHAGFTGDPAAALRSIAVLLAMAVALGAVAAWRINRGWGRSRLL